MNYDRRYVESVKQKPQTYRLPFVRLFIILTALTFALTVLLH
ncbi:MAG TPA: hypothetical protein VI612_00330 [Candidatus Nanoarchaeia archaeon]|nr:hypothetical protein [Candidatus Nanoarchaeia archaeon]